MFKRLFKWLFEFLLGKTEVTYEHNAYGLYRCEWDSWLIFTRLKRKIPHNEWVAEQEFLERCRNTRIPPDKPNDRKPMATPDTETPKALGANEDFEDYI